MNKITETNNEKVITSIPFINWKERERKSKLLTEIYGKQNVEYCLFRYTETRIFEKGYSSLDTKEEYLYICKGTLKDLLSDLEIWRFNQNELVETESNTLKLNLIQTSFPKDIIRYPERLVVEGEFYQLIDDEFYFIPFETHPITDKRNIFLSPKLNDSVKINKKLKDYISNKLTPTKTNDELNGNMIYTPIIKENVESYVPHKVNNKAFQLAKQHNLNCLEFNFLNYFYETRKALRNGNGQLFYDIHSKGIGWRHDREWVKEKMKNLVELGLVKFEIRHDCRDKRYTSWYWYDANAKLDRLKHEF